MQYGNDHFLNEKKNSQFVKNKVFFNYFDKKSQEAMLKIPTEMQKSLFCSFKMIKLYTL